MMPIATSIRRFRCLAFLCGLVGCTSYAPEIVEKLDPKTGVSVTFVKTPLVLYRETPARAAYARDYAHLAPIHVNRSGNYQNFLWVGSWATMQRSDLSAHRGSFESIVIFADGEPLLLEVSGWTPAAMGASEITYLKPAASVPDAYYSVTRDQIRLIASAREIRLHTRASPSREYALWSDQNAARRSLMDFLDRTKLR